MFERKEEEIEAEILEYFELKGYKVNYKNDIKGFYNSKKGYYQRNKSNFIKPGIADITIYRKPYYIAIEVKKPSEMNSFDRPLKELQERLEEACRKGLKKKTLEKYLHAVQQREFLDGVIEEGGIGFFACSLQQVLDRLKEFGYEK